MTAAPGTVSVQGAVPAVGTVCSLDAELATIVADYAAGQFAAFACVAALLGRAATGKGAYIDASLADTVSAWQGPLLAQHGVSGSLSHSRIRAFI